MNNKKYYSYRIRLEKLKQERWRLITWARLLCFLTEFLIHYFK
jgi:hypothetical protein